MAKILVTESEVRDIIKESVMSVLNETTLNERINYGVDWNNLSDAEKQNIASTYRKRGRNIPIKYYSFSDGTTGNTAYKVENGQYVYGTPVYDTNRAGEIYSNKRGRKERNGNLSYSAEQYNTLQTKSAEQNKTLQAQLTQAQNLNNGYKSAIDQIITALSKVIKENAGASVSPPVDGSLTGTPSNTAPTPDQKAAINAKSAVPNLEQLLTAIANLQKRAGMVSGLQQKIKELTARIQNAAQPAQQAQTQQQNNTQQNQKQQGAVSV